MNGKTMIWGKGVNGVIIINSADLRGYYPIGPVFRVNNHLISTRLLLAWSLKQHHTIRRVLYALFITLETYHISKCNDGMPNMELPFPTMWSLHYYYIENCFPTIATPMGYNINDNKSCKSSQLRGVSSAQSSGDARCQIHGATQHGNRQLP
jgi:hypothetical protein